jgi:plastocyanin
VCQTGFKACGDDCVDTDMDANHCGACNAACPVVANGSAVCSGGKCGVVCNAGYSRCSGQCVNASTDPNNCGGCGTVCGAGQVCSAGACAAGCPSGMTDCAGQCVNTSTDPDHCGNCDSICPVRLNAARRCVAGSCGYSCSSGYGDCDNSGSTGCESNLQTDTAHCGSCTTSCNTTNGDALCAAGSCGITCDAEWGNCDGKASTGCECRLVNGCAPDEIVDLTGQAQITSLFGGTIGHTYRPRCFIVSVGTRITFEGNFKAHPLVGGEISGGTGIPDPTSPFDYTNSGSTVSFTLGAAGDFPYYCETHIDLNMFGAVFVVP